MSFLLLFCQIVHYAHYCSPPHHSLSTMPIAQFVCHPKTCLATPGFHLKCPAAAALVMLLVVVVVGVVVVEEAAAAVVVVVVVGGIASLVDSLATMPVTAHVVLHQRQVSASLLDAGQDLLRGT